MLDFLPEIGISYELLIALLILFIDLIIFILTLFKKHKVVSSVYALIDSSIPFMINKAEEQYPIGFGEVKKDLVIKAVCGLLNTHFGITDFSKYLDYISKHIEVILSTPKKKGGN